MRCTWPSQGRSRSRPPGAFGSARCGARAGTSPAGATSRQAARRPRRASGLLYGCDPFQRGDSLFDRRVTVEEMVEEAAVMLLRVVDAHRGHRVVELLHRLVVAGDLLQSAQQALRVAGELDATGVRERLTLA